MRGRGASLGMAAVVTAVLAAGATYMLWSTDAEASVGVIRSGDLGLELLGDVRWRESSPDTAPHAVMSGPDGVAQHLATPGDTFVLTQALRTDLEGDNLRARLTVGWRTPPTLPGGVVGTYVVTDPSGTPSAETPLGTATTLPGAAASLSQGTGEWTVTVTLSWTGASDLVVPPGALAGGPPTAADLGTLLVDLRQVRDGDGFTP